MHLGDRKLVQVRRLAGTTLIETMIVVALIGTAIAIAIPTFQTSITRNTIATTVNEFQSAISLARSDALASRYNTVVQPVSGADWAAGWVVFTDRNFNNLEDAVPPTPDIRIYSRPTLPIGMTVTDNASGAPIIFQPSGFSQFSTVLANRTITFTLKGSSTILCVAPTGRVRVLGQTGTCS
jgi:Tfp pilus assembly protein FimT